MNATSNFFASLRLPTAASYDFWSDEVMSVWVPVVAYWAYSLAFHFLMKAQLPFFEKYRIHTVEDMTNRNRVSLSRVLVMVSLQQLIQVILGLLVITPKDPVLLALKEQATLRRLENIVGSMASFFIEDTAVISDLGACFLYYIARPVAQFLAGMVIMDTHQYFLHRLFHLNKFLYKHIHSHHHRLYVPYAFGALYNHPVEGFLLDTLGAALSFELTGMSPRLAMIFFSFSNMKTVDDHCGYALPWDPLQFLFGNNVVYHDIHHQPYGIKKNFSQPYFTFWDWLLDTKYVTPVEKKSAKAD